MVARSVREGVYLLSLACQLLPAREIGFIHLCANGSANESAGYLREKVIAKVTMAATQ